MIHFGLPPSYQTITWTGDYTQVQYGDGDGDVTVPANTVEGDLLLLAACQRGGDGTLSCSGFTNLGSARSSIYLGDRQEISVAYRFATSSEPASYFADHIGSAGGATFTMLRITGVREVGSVLFEGELGAGGVGKHTNGPIIQVESGMIVHLLGIRGNASWLTGWDSPFVDMYEASDSWSSIGLAYFNGGAGPVSGTWNSNSNFLYPASAMIQLKPSISL